MNPDPRLPDPRIIVGLDLPDVEAAREMVARLGDTVGFYKVGLGLLASGGLDLVAGLKRSGRQVFLDLKLFDISATVTSAVRGLMRLEPDFLTVHGDPHVVRAAVAGRGDAPTRILAVTILTSLDRGDLNDALIVPGDVDDLVVRRAQLALAAGADGLIASPREAARLRLLPEAKGRLLVTPGVRPSGAAMGDQKRVATPGEAIAAGADHVVVARPVISAPDPAAAVRAIAADLAAA